MTTVLPPPTLAPAFFPHHLSLVVCSQPVLHELFVIFLSGQFFVFGCGHLSRCWGWADDDWQLSLFHSSSGPACCLRCFCRCCCWRCWCRRYNAISHKVAAAADFQQTIITMSAMAAASLPLYILNLRRPMQPVCVWRAAGLSVLVYFDRQGRPREKGRERKLNSLQRAAEDSRSRPLLSSSSAESEWKARYSSSILYLQTSRSPFQPLLYCSHIFTLVHGTSMVFPCCCCCCSPAKTHSTTFACFFIISTQLCCVKTES